MVFISAGGKDINVNPDDYLEDRKEFISVFRFQRNINASLLEKKT